MQAATLSRVIHTGIILLAALALAGCAANLHHRSGMADMEKGAYVDGVKELELASQLAPDDMMYRQDLLANREKAIQRLQDKAASALAEGKNPEAEQSFQAILRIEPDNARARAGLEALVRTTRAAEDAAQAREALKRSDIPTAQQWIARALERAPDQAEALAVKRDIEAIQAKELITVPNLGNVYKKPINLEFRDASLKMVFEALSRTTSINFIFDHDVKSDQHTTVFLKQTSLEDAIDVILTTNQLNKKILNNSSVLIYPNTAAKTKEYQDLIVKAFYIANGDVKQTATMLKTVLKIKESYVDEKTNMLVLRENPDTIALAEKLIALQDVDEPEVMLDVEVLEVTRTRTQDLGIQLPTQITVAPLSSLTTTSSTSGTTSTGTGTQTMSLSDLRHLNSSMLGTTVPSATLNFQKVDSDVNLLANPRIRVRDKEKAKILIGDKVPVVTTTTTATGFVGENIQYIDVGIKLDVEPEIRLHDEVGLKLALEVSSIDSTITTSNGSHAYQIGTRNFNSVLRLKDGETQILGGLISKTDSSNANKFPILGEIPLLGRLFSNQNDDLGKTEIVMSITPHLIRNIRRLDPASETFWSGTEDALRTKPLQLRNMDGVAAQATAASKKAPAPVGQAAAPGTQLPPSANGSVPVAAPAAQQGNLKLQWKGPTQAKVGQPITLELDMDSVEPLKTVPLQLAYVPSQFEVIDVKAGDFFNKGGKAIFNRVIDKQSGRITVGSGTDNPTGVKGAGSLLTIELKPLAEAPEASISLIGLTPIGGAQAPSRIALPLAHKLEVVP
ncbi:MAG: general secretion pathway protein GspD [Burkholderiaceae bacterium]|nr:general secretion pathway protein GspD [Burkholderiaceae bacterium]